MASTQPSALKLGIGYSRYSTERQGSIPQQDRINVGIAADHGVAIVAKFADAAVSRSLSDREQLLLAFEYLETHRDVRFIVTNELERLTAGVAQRAKVQELCKRLGVTILTEDMGAIDPFDEDAMFAADQRAVAGHGEVLKIRRRTRRTVKERVRSGVVQMRPAFGVRMKPVLGLDGNPLPRGTRLVDAAGRKVSSGELEIEESELPWVGRMFAWADEGHSDDEIARRLTEAQVPTKSGNAAWRGNTVAGILTNPFYRGEMTWGRHKTVRDADGKRRTVERDPEDPEILRLPSPLGALVDPELYERVQAKRAAKIGRRGKPRTNARRVFDELAHCFRCGNKMYGQNDARGQREAHRNIVIWRYLCYSGRPGFLPAPGFDMVCTTAHTMSEKKIFAALAELAEESTPNLVTVRTAVPADREAQRTLIRKEIANLQAEHDRARRLAVKGLLTEDELATEIAERDRAMADAETRLAALGAVAPQTPFTLSTEQRRLMTDLVALLRDESIPVTDRRDALRRFGVTKIYVDNPRVLVELVA